MDPVSMLVTPREWPQASILRDVAPIQQHQPIHELLSILSPDKKRWPFPVHWVDRLPKCARKAAI
jgi:hypothetical protein